MKNCLYCKNEIMNKYRLGDYCSEACENSACEKWVENGNIKWNTEVFEKTKKRNYSFKSYANINL